MLAATIHKEVPKHSVRLKLNILSADQAVDENLQRNRISVFFLHSLIVSLSVQFFLNKLTWWVVVRADVYQEKSPIAQSVGG